MPFWKSPKAAPVMSLAARLLIATAGVALIVYTGDTTRAFAKPKQTPQQTCTKERQKCEDRCRKVYEQPTRIKACYHRCDVAYVTCQDKANKKTDSKLGQVPKDPPTKPQGLPPTGGLLETTPSFHPPRPSGTGKVAPN